MDKVRVPLRVKARPPGAGGLRQVVIVLQVLCDRDLPARSAVDLIIDVLHQRPAVGDAAATTVVLGADIDRRVPTKPVGIELIEPVQRVVLEEGPHLATPVVGACVAPWSGGPPVLEEVDPAVAARRRAVESPHVQIARAQVVVDHIDDHRDAALMALIDEVLHILRVAVDALGRKRVRRVVAP